MDFGGDDSVYWINASAGIVVCAARKSTSGLSWGNTRSRITYLDLFEIRKRPIRDPGVTLKTLHCKRSIQASARGHFDHLRLLWLGLRHDGVKYLVILKQEVDIQWLREVHSQAQQQEQWPVL